MKRTNFGKKLLGHGEIGTLIPMVVLFIIAAFMNPNFMQVSNYLDILRTTSYSFCVAIAVTFLMTAGELDLSIGAVMSLGSVTAAFSMVKLGLPIWVSILIALLIGALFGAFNGFLIIKLGLPAFITTLGTQYMLNGLISVVTTNSPISGVTSDFSWLGQGRLFDLIPYTIIITVILGILGHFLLTRMKYGRSVAAVGGNKETAYVSGINVSKIKISVYIMTSIFAALAGVMMCSRFSSGQPTAGTGKEMTIMAAVIIGGTSMFGGSGSITGSFLGCLLFALITNVLVFMGVSTLWQNVIFGTILVLSLILDKYRAKLNEKM